jgi:hypothetical protein
MSEKSCRNFNANISALGMTGADDALGKCQEQYEIITYYCGRKSSVPHYMKCKNACTK